VQLFVLEVDICIFPTGEYLYTTPDHLPPAACIRQTESIALRGDDLPYRVTCDCSFSLLGW
jgi:hypothetical protein